MAKSYVFKFSAQKAEVTADGRGFSVHYGGPETVYRQEIRELSFKDAQEYLKKFSAETKGPHSASFRLASPTERAPAGYNNFNNRCISKYTN